MAKKIQGKSTRQNTKTTSQPRRSNRQRKAPKDDQYWRGLPNQYAWFGGDVSDESIFPKRQRKRRADDNDDYQGGSRSAKKRNINTNKIQALLEWRDLLEEQQLKIVTDNDINDHTIKMPALFKEKVSKSIVNEKLQDIAQNVEALFVNIQWNKKGQTLQDFKKLNIESTKFMSKGIAFVWVPKQLVSEILEIMKKKNFFYVENLEVINLDREKALNIYCPNLKKSPILTKQKSQLTLGQTSETNNQLNEIIKYLDGIQPNELIIESSSPYFNRSKRTLLMFRKLSNQKVQLRHQRTSDVVFDMPCNPQGKCQSIIKSYIYSMIETLLPESLIIEYKNKTELGFKLVELWADKAAIRRGWITVVQQ